MARPKRNRIREPKRRLPKLPTLPRPNVDWRALAFAAAAAVVGVVGIGIAREVVEVPVRKLNIEGRFQRVTELEILSAAQPALDQNFLTLDLADIRQRIAEIDWVDSVTLQRVWPDTLKISYTEHQAAASWGQGALLNTRGELFAEDVRHEYRELPKLDGPDGSHRRVAAFYLRVKDRLSKSNLTLESIEMDQRGSFAIKLVGGLSVLVGRDDIDGRVERFFSVAVPSLLGDMDRASRIDLRYPNGFAVEWNEPANEQVAVARSGNSG